MGHTFFVLMNEIIEKIYLSIVSIFDKKIIFLE